MLFKKADKVQHADIKTAKGFEEVYHQYAAKVYNICRAKTSYPAIAEELVQDIFRSLWERREQLNIKESIEHYLNRAAKLKVIDYYRQKSRDEKYMAHVIESFSDRSHTTEETIDYHELQTQVAHLTNQLSPKAKEVFVLSKENGCTNKEIAARLLISEKAVEYHMSKALKCLKSGLVGYGY